MKEVLPPGFLEDKNILKLGEFVEAANCMLSRILFCRDGKRYLINFKPSRPYFAEDWRTYNVMRGWAKAMITPSHTVSNWTFEEKDKEIEQYFQNRHKGSRQNLIIWKSKFNRNELLEKINPDHYKLYNEDEEFEK